MKNPLSWIRWKYFLPLALVVAALAVFLVIFLDPLLERTIEKYAGKANGARVDVTGLKTKIFKGRLSIQNLQVADPESLMRNQLEAGPLAFQIDLAELVGRRVIINEASWRGMAFNTPRKTSGALPRLAKKKTEGPPSAAEKLATAYKDRFKLNIDGIKGEAKSRIEFDPKQLELVKAAESLKEQAESLPDNWEKRVKGLAVEEKIKKAEADLKIIKNTPLSGTEALTAIPANLKKLNEVRSQLDGLKKEVTSLKTEFQTEIKDLKKDVAGLSAAKKKDVDDLMSRLNLDFASPQRLIEGMIGPAVLEKFTKVFHYVQLARQHMPSKKEKESLPPKPRAQGMDIEFPTPAALPRFWLMKAALDGVFGEISASGKMTDLTSDPARVGKPFRLDLNGVKETQKYTLNAVLDHSKDVSSDSVVFNATGLDVKQLLSSGQGPSDFTQGTGRMEVDLKLVGWENLAGYIGLGLSELKFDEAVLLSKVGITDAATLNAGDKLKVDFMRNVARSIEGMKEVVVHSEISGTWNDPQLKINSNMAAILSGVIKDSVGNLVKEQRQQLEARLNQLFLEKQKEVTNQLAGLESKINGQLGGIDSQITQKISEATGINLKPEGGSPIPGIKIPSLDKFFKK